MHQAGFGQEPLPASKVTELTASSALGYAAGFAIASCICHASGVLIALGASRTPWGGTPIRVLGFATFGAAVYMSSSLLTG